MVKKILIITPYFPPALSYGGPPKVLYILAKEMVKQGKEVTVITTDALNNQRNPVLSEVMDGIKVVRFKTISNNLAYKNKIFYIPKLLNQAKVYIDINDVVLFSDLRTIINWQLYNYIWQKKIPYGIFPFGQVPLGSGILAKIKNIFDLIWVKDFVSKASWLFYQTRHEKMQLLEHYAVSAENTYFFPLPVENQPYTVEKSELISFKNKWNILPSDNVLLFVGRLHYLKGVDILIESVKPLLKSDKHLKLMIVGRDDGEEEKLKKQASQEIGKHIIFTGPLYGKEAAKAYLTAKCFVYTPRFFEETSLAALEALSFGVPIIVSYQAEVPFLEKYHAGCVIENDKKLIRKEIINMLEKKKIQKAKLQENTQKLIRENHTVSKVAGRLLTAFDII